MVKVLAVEGNRIKLSRKALIKEQKAKLVQTAPVEAEGEAEEVEISASESPAAPAAAAAPQKPRNEFDEHQPKSNQSTILIEGGDDFEEGDAEEFDEENEPNFNRIEGAPAPVPQPAGAGRPAGAGNNSNRRRRRRRPGGGGRGPSSGGGQA
jgi:polyribonucleotide nucleotidyltransferase